jgi:hypothetical protein
VPATTYASLLTALANVTVAGVARRYTLAQSPPAVEPRAADYPAQFVVPGGASDGAVVAFGGAYKRTFTARIVIEIAAPGLDTSPANYADVVTMVDALNAGLVTAVDTIGGSDTNAPTWAITVPPDANPWRVEATVTVVGV